MCKIKISYFMASVFCFSFVRRDICICTYHRRMIFPLNFLPKLLFFQIYRSYIYIYILFQIQNRLQSPWFQNKLLLLLNTIQPFPTSSLPPSTSENDVLLFILNFKQTMFLKDYKFKTALRRIQFEHLPKLTFKTIL